MSASTPTSRSSTRESRVADLNVAGGYNCSTTNRSYGADVEGHERCSGTVGAIDNDFGVVGVARAFGLGREDPRRRGSGLLSWYVCGLDWIAASATARSHPSDDRVVNMSVTSGARTTTTAEHKQRHLHQAICASSRAASRSSPLPPTTRQRGGPRAAAYNEVITVRARRSDAAGRTRWPRCFSWAHTTTTIRLQTSAIRLGRRHHRAGKCIWSRLRGGYQYRPVRRWAPHSRAPPPAQGDRAHLTPAEGSRSSRTSARSTEDHERPGPVSQSC